MTLRLPQIIALLVIAVSALIHTPGAKAAAGASVQILSTDCTFTTATGITSTVACGSGGFSTVLAPGESANITVMFDLEAFDQGLSNPVQCSGTLGGICGAFAPLAGTRGSVEPFYSPVLVNPDFEYATAEIGVGPHFDSRECSLFCRSGIYTFQSTFVETNADALPDTRSLLGTLRASVTNPSDSFATFLAILPIQTAIFVQSVPEPSDYALILVGLGFVAFAVRRRRV